MSADVAILIPTKSRSERLEEVARNASHPDARVYFIMEPDEIREVRGAAVLTRSEGFGRYAAAANYGYKATAEPLIFNAADDLKFHDGWLEAARSRLSETIKVVGTNDLGLPQTLAGESATHHLVDRRYLDEQGGVFDEGPGSFFCEAYAHNYPDTELAATAQSRGVWAPCLEAVVEHLHPLWGKAAMDPTYARGFETASSDAALWSLRSAQLGMSR